MPTLPTNLKRTIISHDSHVISINICSAKMPNYKSNLVGGLDFFKSVLNVCTGTYHTWLCSSEIFVLYYLPISVLFSGGSINHDLI